MNTRQMTLCNLPSMKLNSVTILLFFLGACMSREKGIPYKYFDELNKYLTEYHLIRIPAEENIYLLIIPVGGCTPCVEESLAVGIEQANNANLKVVLLADSPKVFIPYRSLIELLNKKSTYLDMIGRDNDFETGIFSPTIFHFKEGKLIYYKELSVDKIAGVKRDLQWN